MPQRILYLTNQDSKRLAEWLSQFDEIPPGCNRGRFGMMQLGTSWISTKEIKALSDAFPPYDATGIIRGSVVLTSSEEIPI